MKQLNEFKLVVLLFIAGVFTLSPAFASKSCLTGGDDTTLQAALDASTNVPLCPKAVFVLRNTVVFKQPGQSLFTLGNPAEKRQALLLVAGREQATALHSRVSGTHIHHVRVDGQRKALGRLPKGGALIEVGGSGVEGVTIDHVRAFDPRGWSVMHAFEGDKTCTHVRIEDNRIGPAGQPDGQWADGISLACRNSMVARNEIIDASDGGIVVFGAPGSIIENNRIITKKNVLLGGINMVDYKPYDGDFTGTVVRNNHIIGKGGYIKVAIAVGPSVWGADNQNVVRGGKVLNNRITGSRHVGFGIAVDGVKDFEVMGNRNDAGFSGEMGERCAKELKQVSRREKLAMVRNLKRSTGRFQEMMFDLEVRYAICVN